MPDSKSRLQLTNLEEVLVHEPNHESLHFKYLILIHTLHKIRERKVKTLTKIWRDHGEQAHGNKIDGHGHLSQSEESKCMWTHDGVTRMPVHCDLFNFW